jgi:hypothetical protein
MVVRIENKSWWVDFWFNHTRYRKRSPENSRTGAFAYEATLRQKLGRGESIDRVAHEEKQEQTFEQFARKWFQDYVVPNNKYSEQQTKKILLKAFLIPFFGKMQIEQISAHDIERYKAHAIKEGVTNKTIKNRLTVLNKCLATAYEWLELDGKLDESLVDPKLEPRLNQILLPLLSVVSDESLRADLRSMALEAQISLVADRGLLVEAQVLEILAELMAGSERPVIPVADIVRVFIERYGFEYERPITNRWIGSILRKRLNIGTYKSHGVYVVPTADRPKIEMLCGRYGVSVIGELPPVV